jgi:hypothetical protein
MLTTSFDAVILTTNGRKNPHGSPGVRISPTLSPEPETLWAIFSAPFASLR